MASSVILHKLCSISLHSPKCYKNQTLALTHSQFLSSKSFLKLKKQSLLSSIHVRNPSQKSRSASIVFAAQTNFLKALQTVWKVGRDGIEAGTNLVPDSVPRPMARISVTLVALTVSLFVLKSFLSTAFFALATMGLVYFAFIALNKDKDEGPRGGGGTTSTVDSLEEAKRIMEKYK
ncbi:uncharacterized protein LOC133857775 [Alnus glutinosa]|uniref:uncharacterized protein LOC133857775 n=1 Tax=Alnus glutinosa TaxID=3517 RepID=UPI002D77036B|nr:uncharacterized protein LOC133857775 [Alnus glutinosa]